MTELEDVSDETLEAAQTLGATAYLRAYITRVGRALGMPMDDPKEIDEMVIMLVEPMNSATTAMFCASVGDKKGMKKELQTFRKELEKFIK